MVREGLQAVLEIDEVPDLAHGVLALVGGEGGDDILRCGLEVDALEVRALAHDEVDEPLQGRGRLSRRERLAHYEVAVLAVEGDLGIADVLEAVDAEAGGDRLVKLRGMHLGTGIELGGGSGGSAHGGVGVTAGEGARNRIAGPCTAPLIVCAYPT